MFVKRSLAGADPTDVPTADATARARLPSVLLVHAALLALAAFVVVQTAGAAVWNGWAMAVIGTFTVLSSLTYFKTGVGRITIQGTPLGLLLAAVLLGAAPAACFGVVAALAMQARARAEQHYLRNNLITFVWYPLIGGLVFHQLVALFHLQRTGLGFYVAVLPAFWIAIGVNFIGVAGYQCWLDRSSLLEATKQTLVPVLPAELFASLLTMGAVWISVRTGTVGMALLGLMLLIFQFLVGELLKSKARAVELQRMATTDGLTGLANRQAFVAQVAEQISSADPNTRLALSLIDLDRFKEINDTLGHHYGDQLLCEVARRLVQCVGPDGVVARLGGDEFVVLSREVGDHPGSAIAHASRMGACVQEPFTVDELAISVGSSIGIARFPQDGADVHELMRRADVAMYAAKEKQSGYKLYAKDLDHHSVQRMSLLGDITRALSARELLVHYQPIISADDYSLEGAEALIRWQHPERGLLSPDAFIGSVEQTSMIHPLTLLVLEQSIAQCAEWHASGLEIAVGVNLSVRNLHNPALPNEIEALLAQYELPPAALKLEITESMIMADPDLVTATIARLNSLGIRLSVDDFGTGFSSLAYLKNLPIGELKIDRSFVSPMLSSESDLIIVRSTINLGHDLGLRVVAEGVEDAPTLTRLSGLGCDLIQGYHVSKPLPADAFSDWVRGTSVPLPSRSAAAA
jgi:diguanylate cyclase (GGDEF)-like protein